MKEILINFEHCVACKSCELACAVEHSASKNIFTAIFEERAPVPRIYVEAGYQFNFPLQCRHCVEAQCIKACVTDALWRDEETGLVKHTPEKCIGCWICVMACPFGAIVQDRKERIILKCDRCPEREIPACVAACPTKAISLQGIPFFAGEKRKAYLSNFQEA
jgi:carbon-monoxide dehydrogenase iron sulfur subunit